MSHNQPRSGLSRRRLIGGAASAGLALFTAPAIISAAAAQSWRSGDPFRPPYDPIAQARRKTRISILRE
jgi:hypothetical protein